MDRLRNTGQQYRYLPYIGTVPGTVLFYNLIMFSIRYRTYEQHFFIPTEASAALPFVVVRCVSKTLNFSKNYSSMFSRSTTPLEKYRYRYMYSPKIEMIR